MRTFAEARPTVITVAAIVTVVLASLLTAGAAFVVVSAAYLVPEMYQEEDAFVGALVAAILTVVIFILAGLAVGLFVGAWRLRHGDPIALRAAAIMAGAMSLPTACLFAQRWIQVEGVGSPVLAAVAAGFAGLSFAVTFLPTIGAGRTWLAARRGSTG